MGWYTRSTARGFATSLAPIKSEGSIGLRDFVWTGRIQPASTSDVTVRVEINTGEAVRFGRFSGSAFDSRGVPIERHHLLHDGLDEFFAYHVQREAVPRPMQAFVLCARCEGNAYAFSVLFDPFDAKAVAGAPASHYRNLVDVFLGNHLEGLPNTVLHQVMEEFFAREDCLEDLREYTLQEVVGVRKGNARRLFLFDPHAGWTRPWERIELPLEASKGVELHFLVTQNRRRIYVDRLEEEESQPAIGVPISIELPTYKGTVRKLQSVTDEDGCATIKVKRLGNKLRKRFIIGTQETSEKASIWGHFLLRPPQDKKNFNNGPQLPGIGSRATPDDLQDLLLADLKASYDSDIDSYTDILSGEPVSPTFERATLLSSAFGTNAPPPEIKRFIARSKRRTKNLTKEDSDYTRLSAGLALGCKIESLITDIDEHLKKWGDVPLKIWTAQDGRFISDTLLMAVTSKSKKLKASCQNLLHQFCLRLRTELEPTYYIHYLKRPIKTYCASSDPVIPHGEALIALIAAKHYIPEAVDDSLLEEQASHMMTRHGYYDAIPDIVAHGRKQAVELGPLLTSACACKVLLTYRREKLWQDKMAGYKHEIFAQYRDHYQRLTLMQRFEILRFAVAGLPPYFDVQGNLMLWRKGQQLKPNAL